MTKLQEHVPMMRSPRLLVVFICLLCAAAPAVIATVSNTAETKRNAKANIAVPACDRRPGIKS